MRKSTYRFQRQPRVWVWQPPAPYPLPVSGKAKSAKCLAVRRIAESFEVLLEASGPQGVTKTWHDAAAVLRPWQVRDWVAANPFTLPEVQ